MKPVIIQWEEYEYRRREHSVDWFWAVGLAGLSVAVGAIVLGNALFGGFVIVATVALILQSLRKPRLVRFGISERGVHIGKTMYPFSSLESFWITAEEPPVLLIKSHGLLTPMLTIPLKEGSATRVYDALSELLPEEEHFIPLSQRLMEFLGF